MNIAILLSILGIIEATQALLLTLRFVTLNPLGTFCLFVLFLVLAQVSVSYFFDRRDGDRFKQALVMYLVLQGILTAMLLQSIFKQVVYDYQSQLARGAFDVIMVLAILVRVFWFKVKAFLVSLHHFIIYPANQRALTTMADIVSVLFIAAFIFIPDTGAVLARMFVGEQFHHWDLFMAPAWGYLKGALPYVDTISQYGVGIPVVMGIGGKLLGGFSYEHVFTLMMSACILYYISVYLFLRSWLGSVPLVLTAVFLGIKTQMFHPGVNPIVFTYPSSTVMRNILDVFFFMAILGHLRTGRSSLLWLGSVLCGLAVFNLTDTGLYLTGAFYVYLLFQVMLPDLRMHWSKAILHVLFVPALVLTLFYMVVGPHVFTHLFWDNMQEYIVYFLAGPGTIPMTENLKYHFYWNALMSVSVPLLYLSSMLLVGILCYCRKMDSRHVIVVVMCAYGLGLYHYFVARSVMTSFYVSGLPFVFVLMFWSKMAIERMKLSWQLPVKMGMMTAAFFALMTTHQVAAYPNCFNLSRNPMTDPKVSLPWPDLRRYFNHLFITYGPEYRLPLNSLGETDEWLYTQDKFESDTVLKKFYAQEFDLKEDAALISSLTSPTEEAAIFSSFEVKLLMQSDRRPFFYFTPVLFSRPMHMRMYPTEGIHSAAYLRKTVAQIRDFKPPYIFMERIFLQDKVPDVYNDDFPRLIEIATFIRDHYEPTAVGKYLVAMKRKKD